MLPEGKEKIMNENNNTDLGKFNRNMRERGEGVKGVEGEGEWRSKSKEWRSEGVSEEGEGRGEG